VVRKEKKRNSPKPTQIRIRVIDTTERQGHFNIWEQNDETVCPKDQGRQRENGRLGIGLPAWLELHFFRCRGHIYMSLLIGQDILLPVVTRIDSLSIVP
jgi:hypothetical protein